MKNIHLIPTDKPSRLHLGNSGLVLCDLNFSSDTINGQHLYITSDEEIKEGDWYIYLGQINKRTRKNPKAEYPFPNYQKIILTTDQDLIKDGIQAIDDEFLEWFVNNSSCEKVKIEEGVIKHIAWSKELESKYDFEKGYPVTGYKIIIPKEEPKPHSFCETPEEKCTMNYCDENGCQNRNRVLVEELKQETLEEVAEKLILEYELGNTGKIDTEDAKEMLIEFAKYQAERSYSEEEVKNIVSQALESALVTVDLEQWFNQFKKK